MSRLLSTRDSIVEQSEHLEYETRAGELSGREADWPWLEIITCYQRIGWPLGGEGSSFSESDVDLPLSVDRFTSLPMIKSLHRWRCTNGRC